MTVLAARGGLRFAHPPYASLRFPGRGNVLSVSFFHFSSGCGRFLFFCTRICKLVVAPRYFLAQDLRLLDRRPTIAAVLPAGAHLALLTSVRSKTEHSAMLKRSG